MLPSQFVYQIHSYLGTFDAVKTDIAAQLHSKIYLGLENRKLV
jgi:hypothetical protein